MVVTAGLILAAIAGGVMATYLYDADARPGTRLCAGTCVGLAAFALIGFVAASAIGFGAPALVVATAGVLSPCAWLGATRVRTRLRDDVTAEIHRLRQPGAAVRGIASLLAWALGLVVLWQVFARAMFVRADGIYSGVTHNFGDLPLHLGVVARFAYGENFPPEHPAYAGIPFTYHFLADFLTAMFVRSGAPLREALVVPSVLVAAAFVGLLYRWTADLTGSRIAAWLAPPLVLLSGGFGWWLFVTEAARHDAGIWHLLTNLTRDYTIRPGHEWRWGNVTTTLLVPQRAILLGLPLAIVVFHQWWRALDDVEGTDARRRMIGAGAIAGLLPLVHAHSYVVVMSAAACLTLLLGTTRMWFWFFAVSLAIGGPQMLWAISGTRVATGSFVGVAFGWDRGDANVLWFWFTNAGLFIPLIAIALLWRGRDPLVGRRLLIFYLPFVIWFLIGNTLRLSPWIWDNIKVLVYWHLASAPIVALLLARLWQGGSWKRAAAVAAFVSLTMAGALDVWRVVSDRAHVQVFSRADTVFADFVSRATPRRALVLHAPTHNHPVFLTGRRSLMGYPGHVWSHGVAYWGREEDIRKIYAGTPEAQALLARYGIEYAVVGPMERRLLPINDRFFARYESVGAAGGYRLYDIRRPIVRRSIE
jgi:hypothetical protein